MGEVYRARDPRIAREVAIKILPADFAENEDRLRRFEQEARATGAVNHPNLLTVFDVGTFDGVPYIVSELLEGFTLRERLQKAVASRRAIEYALQIARGVGAAHDKGIVHRDLKPDNIFITADERVKLLDFGLAKVLRTEASEKSETVQKQDTAEGAVLGTAAYMSPEQVRGQTMDHRTDIFSFGVVLYEMVAGTRPFRADTNVETMASIINDDAPPLPSSVPPALERIIMHALEKVPANRFQSMRDVAFALDTFSGSGETSAVVSKSKSRPKAAPKKADAKYRRITFRRGFILSARFAPDGSVVYGATWEGSPHEIFSVVPGNPESRVTGFPNADILSISPSGELAISLGRKFLAGWVTEGTLAQVPPFGGAPRELADLVEDADWTPDGRQIAVIRHLPEGNAIEAPLGHRIYITPHWINALRVSPRGDHVAVLQHEVWGDDAGNVLILDMQGRRVAQSKQWSSTAGLAWTPSGDEVWTCGEGDTGTRDVQSLSLNGKERTVLFASGRLTLHDISRDGRALVAVENGRREIVGGKRGEDRQRNLSWLDWSFPGGISRDGTRIVFEEQAGGRRAGVVAGSVYVRGTDGSPAVRLGEGRARNFTPDGSAIGIYQVPNDFLDIVPVRIGATKRVPLHGIIPLWWVWTADGTRIIAWGHRGEESNRQFAIDLNGGPPHAITPEGANFFFAVSPDNSTLAAADAKEGVLLYPMAGGGEPPHVLGGSLAGDKPVQWSADGTAVFVAQASRSQSTIFRIDVTNGARKEWLALEPDDPAGIMDMFPVVLTPDGESYAYSYRRFLSDLYIVDNVV
jgi:serine/threonine protein kinase/Tol biopolymer transport system component